VDAAGVGSGGGAATGSDAGSACLVSAVADGESAASTIAMTSPSETLSPWLIFSSTTVPATGAQLFLVQHFVKIHEVYKMTR